MFKDPFEIDFTQAPWIVNNSFYSDEEKEVYMLITNALLKKKVIKIPDLGYSIQSIKRILYDVYYTNPLMFGLKTAHEPIREDGYIIVEIEYYHNYAKWKAEIRHRVMDLHEKMDIGSCKTDLEIEKTVNDWLCKNCVYDDQLDYNTKHSVLGILLGGRGVCSSFALCTSLLLMCFGVSCYPVLGRMTEPQYKKKFRGNKPSEFMKIKFDHADNKPENKKCSVNRTKMEEIGFKEYDYEDYEGHAWNYVFIEGIGRHLDVTFNNGSHKIEGKTNHSFFNLMYDEIKHDRVMNFGPVIE